MLTVAAHTAIGKDQKVGRLEARRAKNEAEGREQGCGSGEGQ